MTKLLKLIAEVLGVDRTMVSAETGPGTLPQWDSMAHMQLVAAVEETYGVQFSIEEIPNILSVNELKALLQEKGADVA